MEILLSLNSQNQNKNKKHRVFKKNYVWSSGLKKESCLPKFSKPSTIRREEDFGRRRERSRKLED